MTKFRNPVDGEVYEDVNPFDIKVNEEGKKYIKVFRGYAFEVEEKKVEAKKAPIKRTTKATPAKETKEEA